MLKEFSSALWELDPYNFKITNTYSSNVFPANLSFLAKKKKKKKKKKEIVIFIAIQSSAAPNSLIITGCEYLYQYKY